jgi:pyruvate/2-oxoglutarate dehydrogenase complex dihydrolipoamide dehydrogenase (E3) component
MVTKYDAIVIGAGQAGVPLAGSLAKAGRKTAIIEREHIGGTCVNEGCSPTKTMIASGRVAHVTRRGPEFGVHVDGAATNNAPVITVDMKRVRQRKRDIVNSFRSSNEKKLEQAGVECIMGEASFAGPKLLDVKMLDGSGTKTVSADLIFINTGERPALPTLPGIDSVPILTSTTIMELDVVPEHLLVLGGGYIGLEFGQLFRRLGAAVTIVQRGKQLLPREDPDIAAEVLKILEEDGITVLLQTSSTEVSKSSTDGSINLTVSGPDGSKILTGSHLLAAAGRKPNSDMLNLSTAGIISDPTHGFIKTSPTLETNVPGVFALGDVKGPPAFTHISYDDYRIIQANLLESRSEELTVTDRLVPYTVFMDPQLGHVGLHEREALALGKKIKVATMPMTWVARALELDETRGMMKAVVDAETDEIIGFTVLGLEGGEIMSIMEVAMMGRLKWMRLRDAVFAHPTLAEGLNNLWATLKDVPA